MSEPISLSDTEKALKRRKVSPSSSVGILGNCSSCRCGSSCKCAEVKEKPTSRKFVCPYYRRYPDEQPSSTSCAYPGFPTIFRVKEHLYRKHKASDTKCSRCQSIFRSEEALETHLRALDVCEIQQAPQAAGFTKAQEQQLRSRKRSGCLTEEQKWLEVYRILFPQTNDEPQPYVEGTKPLDFHRYKDFSREVFRRVLMREIGLPDWTHHDIHDEARKNNLVDFVMRCQEQVFQRFHEDITADSEAPTPDSTVPDENEPSSAPLSDILVDEDNMGMELELWTPGSGTTTISPLSMEENMTLSVRHDKNDWEFLSDKQQNMESIALNCSLEMGGLFENFADVGVGGLNEDCASFGGITQFP